MLTPTRRHFRDSYSHRQKEALTACVLCGAARGSARHMFADCPRFHQRRCELSAVHSIPDDFWSSAPRVTSKSGWVTYGAHPCKRMRACLQIAACQLGMDIVSMGLWVYTDAGEWLDAEEQAAELREAMA